MILLHCIALWWYYDTVALGSVWSRLKPVWLSLVRAETTRFIFVSPLSDWILATSLTTSLHVSTSLQPHSLTTGKTPRLSPNFPKKGLLWKRDLFKNLQLLQFLCQSKLSFLKLLRCKSRREFAQWKTRLWCWGGGGHGKGRRSNLYCPWGEKLEGGQLLGIKRCWSRRREGMLGKVNRYLDGQKNVQKIVILRSGTLGQCEQNQKGAGCRFAEF